MLEHHLVKGIDGEVTVGVGIFERGHGGVKCVSLVAEGGILHGDDLESVLERKKAQFRHPPFQQTQSRVKDNNG